MYIYMKVTTKQRSSYIFRNAPQLAFIYKKGRFFIGENSRN